MSLEDAIGILTAVPERKSCKYGAKFKNGVKYLRRPKWFFWLYIDDRGYLRTHHNLNIHDLMVKDIVAKDWSLGDLDAIKARYSTLRHPYCD